MLSGITKYGRFSLQPWKLFYDADVTKKNQTLDLDYFTKEVDQDWGKGSPVCPIHYVSIGRGRHAQKNI